MATFARPLESFEGESLDYKESLVALTPSPPPRAETCGGGLGLRGWEARAGKAFEGLPDAKEAN